MNGELGLLSIIIPICNTDNPPAHYTGNCIGSIKYFTRNYEIIVVDNASTVELDGLKWKEVVDTYIKNKKNMGVARAWNQGIKKAKGDYIAIVNSDVEVYEHWATDMIESLQRVQLVMATPMYDLPFGRAVEARDRREKWVYKTPDEYLSDFCDFSCFITTKGMYDEVGLFDEKYGLGYGEDVDFRLRLEEKGYVSKSDKRVNTHHIGMATGYTLETQGVKIGKQMDKNKKYTKKKHNLDEYGVPGWRRDAKV